MGSEAFNLCLSLSELFSDCPGAPPILAMHDEIVVECDEADTQQIETWPEKAMVDGMGVVLNAPEVGGPRVPVKVEVESGGRWND